MKLVGARTSVSTHADSELVDAIWSTTDLLRGQVRTAGYRRVILPLTLLRRLDSILAPTKALLLERHAESNQESMANDALLREASGFGFYNTSPLDLAQLLADGSTLALPLERYIAGFSPDVREVFDQFGFDTTIRKLAEAGILRRVLEAFKDIDLSVGRVDGRGMGLVFEELLQKLGELSDISGEYSTPADVACLIAEVLFAGEAPRLQKPGGIVEIYDPCCGVGGSLRSAARRVTRGAEADARAVDQGPINADADVRLFGQEINPEAFATCRAAALILSGDGSESSSFRMGNSLASDPCPGRRFDYLIADPPWGAHWRAVDFEVEREAKLGPEGRFPAGLPRVSDSQLLFLQDLVAHARPAEDGGARIAILTNGAPLFIGDPGRGESEIRRWILENDWLETVVALPEQLFPHTAIGTYLWLLSNRKTPEKRGRVQLIDARSFWEPRRRTHGAGGSAKRRWMPAGRIAQIVSLIGRYDEEEHSVIRTVEALGYREMRIDRPLRLRFVRTSEAVEMLATGPAAAYVVPERGDLTLLNILRVAVDEANGRPLARSTDFWSWVSESVGAGRERLPPEIVAELEAAFGRRDQQADAFLDEEGRPVPDPELRESIRLLLDGRLGLSGQEALERDDAWIVGDTAAAPVGYEIDFAVFERRRLERLAESRGLVPVPARRLFYRVLSGANRDQLLSGQYDAIFAPRGRPGKVLDAAAAAEERLPKDYVGLELRESAGYRARHLARYMEVSSDVFGSYPRTLSDWRSRDLFLPPPNVLEEMSELDDRMLQVAADVQSLRSALWQEPDARHQIEERFGNVARTPGFVDWLETLPFPLASVLWAAQAHDQKPLEKIRYMRQFFEALAAFSATLLLSGYRNAPEFFEEERPDLPRILERRGAGLSRPGFGHWVAIVERFSKLLRGHLSSAAGKAAVCEAFRVRDDSPLRALADKALVGALTRANTFRNRWDAHGGAVDDAAAEEACVELFEYLLQYRSAVEDSWENWWLIQPEQYRYTRGLHHGSAKLLRGTRTPFEGVSMALDEPGESGELHMYDRRGRYPRVLRLIPFMYIGETPKEAKNACYFYNRIDGSDFRFVSYHSADHAAVTVPGSTRSELRDVVELFEQK